MNEKLIKKLKDRLSSNETAIGFIENEIPIYEETVREFDEITISREKEIISVSSNINSFQQQIVSIATSAFNVGCGTTVGATTVYPDTVKNYSENLSSESYDGPDPFGGQTSSLLSSSNVGFGTLIVPTQNDSSQVGLGTLYAGIGSCFRIPCTTNICIDFNAEIASLESQITTLRGELSSKLSIVNTIRDEKRNSQIELYGQTIAVKSLKQRTSEIQSAINAINNL